MLVKSCCCYVQDTSDSNFMRVTESFVFVMKNWLSNKCSYTQYTKIKGRKPKYWCKAMCLNLGKIPVLRGMGLLSCWFLETHTGWVCETLTWVSGDLVSNLMFPTSVTLTEQDSFSFYGAVCSDVQRKIIEYFSRCPWKPFSAFKSFDSLQFTFSD